LGRANVGDRAAYVMPRWVFKIASLSFGLLRVRCTHGAIVAVILAATIHNYTAPVVAAIVEFIYVAMSIVAITDRLGLFSRLQVKCQTLMPWVCLYHWQLDAVSVRK